MKTATLAVVCAFALACASAPEPAGTSADAAVRPELEFVQITGPADMNYPAGDIEVQYGLRILNRAKSTITLRRIELRSLGLGGPYTLVNRSYPFNKTIASGQSEDVIWWARAYAEGNAFAGDATAPVNVRAVAFFETGNGAMIRQIVTRQFSQ